MWIYWCGMFCVGGVCSVHWCGMFSVGGVSSVYWCGMFCVGGVCSVHWCGMFCVGGMMYLSLTKHIFVCVNCGHQQSRHLAVYWQYNCMFCWEQHSIWAVEWLKDQLLWDEHISRANKAVCKHSFIALNSYNLLSC